MADFDNVIVVVPTIRLDSIRQFLDAWQFPCRVIVIEDNPERSFQLPPRVDHYAWGDIEADLGADSWIIPRRSDCVRSYGYWKAWQAGAEVIVTLDDDCLPIEQIDATRFLRAHYNNLQPRVVPRWHSTTMGVRPRGYPYEADASVSAVGISHGLWFGVPDYDAITQLHARRYGMGNPLPAEGVVPRGSYYPMCGMNLAWRREYTPLMYFLLMGQDAQGSPYPYDRFGDIWAGVISKKILDHLGVGVYSGSPVVRHERASNVWANLRKEAPGLEVNETFWQWVDAVRLTGETPGECYAEIADAMSAVVTKERWEDPQSTRSYWEALSDAMHVWGGLYA